MFSVISIKMIYLSLKYIGIHILECLLEILYFRFYLFSDLHKYVKWFKLAYLDYAEFWIRLSWDLNVPPSSCPEVWTPHHSVTLKERLATRLPWDLNAASSSGYPVINPGVSVGACRRCTIDAATNAHLSYCRISKVERVGWIIMQEYYI